MTPKVWIETGLVLIYGANLDAEVHSHVAIQVIWPQQDAECNLNAQDVRKLVILDSKVEHRLNMSEGWILLVEPSSALGEQLKAKLNGHSSLIVDSTFNEIVKFPMDQATAFQHLAPLFDVLNVQKSLLNINEHSVTDLRIGEVLAKLTLCFQQDCIEPDAWKASEVAKRLKLSESRFLHLFTAQVGIAWRPFLLWKRMMCALRNMIRGASATEAAYIAGFADSAHLSRTFKNNFGMTIKQAKQLLG